MNGIEKKIRLLLFQCWFWIAITIITPALVDYLFDDKSVLSELFSQIVSFSIPALFLITRIRKHKLEMVYYIYDVSFKEIGICVFFEATAYAGLYFLFSTYSLNCIDILYLLIFGNRIIESSSESVGVISFAFILIVYAVFPAIFEEIVFRGAYSDAYRRNNPKIVYLVSSVAFAFSHSSLSSIISALFFALLLTGIYQKRKSILLVIVSHFIYNALVLLFDVLYTLPFSAVYAINNYANEKQLILSLIMSAVISIICVSALLYLILSNVKKDKGEKKADNEIERMSIGEIITTAFIVLIPIVGRIALILIKVYT